MTGNRYHFENATEFHRGRVIKTLVERFRSKGLSSVVYQRGGENHPIYLRALSANAHLLFHRELWRPRHYSRISTRRIAKADALVISERGSHFHSPFQQVNRPIIMTLFLAFKAAPECNFLSRNSFLKCSAFRPKSSVWLQRHGTAFSSGAIFNKTLLIDLDFEWSSGRGLPYRLTTACAN